jgi:hypothetical protein
MAVHLATVADYLKRTTALLPATGDSTVCLWVRFDTVAVSPLYQTAYVILDDPAVYTEYVAIYGQSTQLFLDGNFTSVTTTAPTANTWYHVAWVQSGTTQRFYVNGTLIGSQTHNRAAVTNGFELIGGDTFSEGDVSVAYCREWTSALTQNEIRTELVSPTVVKTTSLYMDCPFIANINDISGNSHNWTQVGSATFVAGPTLLTNTQASTAIDCTPPYSGTFKMSPLTALNPHVWFTYTAVTDDVVIGSWAFTSLASPNRPSCKIWTGTPSALVALHDSVDINDSATNVPYSVPITPGSTYFFDVTNAGVDVSGTADLTFSTVAQPTLDMALGDVMVSDETFGFPVVSLNAVTGAVKRHHVFSAGESVDTQPDGTVLADAIDFLGATIGLQIWDANFTLQQTVAYPVGVNDIYHIYTSPAGGWWISGHLTATTTRVVKMSVDGTYSPTVYTITHASTTHPVGIAVNSAETILYYSLTGTANVAVQRWDLVNDIALADLVAGVVNYAILQDPIVLSDDTIIIGYKRPPQTDSYVTHYSAAGATLNTYNLGAVGLNRLCRALDNPTSFWVWIYPIATPTDGLDRFVNITVSSGLFATDYTVAQYERGVYSAAASATPSARFGPSFSCPMWIYPATVPIPSGDPVRYRIRRERIFPHLSQEQIWQFFSMFQLDVEAGIGLSEGQGSDPQVILQWSDDGGHTWSHEHFVSAGPQGQYARRALWRMLGRSRDRVWKIAMSDPVKWAVLNAFCDVQKGTS